MYIPGIPPVVLWLHVPGGVDIYIQHHHLFASVSEETTVVPYVDPLYEEYDYGDCTSTAWITSQHYTRRRSPE